MHLESIRTIEIRGPLVLLLLSWPFHRREGPRFVCPFIRWRTFAYSLFAAVNKASVNGSHSQVRVTRWISAWECVLIVYLTSKESSGHFQTRPCHFTITRILAAPHLCQQLMLSVFFFFTELFLELCHYVSF